ncbi:hypothetical protein B0H19DRAFT_1253296 [Mycena capillaripes]|nr:hypothetical protein B0H19DRAFT_1253296 [Mycena capillaripes]
MSRPWKVYCISGEIKDTISAEMCKAHKEDAPYAARYAYYPPRLPPDYAVRHFDFGKFYYGNLGIEHDDLAGRAAALAAISVQSPRFISSSCVKGPGWTWGKPLVISLRIIQLKQRHRHFMQSVTIGVRARGLESVTQLSVPKYDEIIRKHLPIPESELVASSISLGYPDPERIAKHYARPGKRELKDVLEIHGM